MTVITQRHILETCVHPFTEEHLTPQGIDLCVSGIYRMQGRGILYRDDKILPEYEPVELSIWSEPLTVTFDDNGVVPSVHPLHVGWRLVPGMYLVDFAEQVAIPSFAMATMHPRSSLLRMGATLNTAIWDAGYRGVSKTTLTVSNPYGIFIEEAARIGHMTFHYLDEAVAGYSGQYQGESPVEDDQTSSVRG